MPAGGARRFGAEFEKALENYHEVLKAQGKAVVHKIGPPLRILGPAGQGALKCILSGKAPSDFIGEAKFNGAATPVKFEAKTFHGKHWKFGEWWTDRKHQPQDLEIWAKVGGLSFVLVRCVSVVVPAGLPAYPCWMLTDREVVKLVADGVKSLSVDALMDYRLLPGLQWFDTARKVMNG